MRRSLMLLSLVALLALTASQAMAGDVFTDEAAGLAFDVPDGWTQKADGNTRTITNGDGTLAVVFTTAEDADWEKAYEGAIEGIKKSFKDEGFTCDDECKPKESEQNGIKTIALSGDGNEVDSGVHLMWDVTLLLSDKTIVATTIASPEVFKSETPVITAFFKSVRKP